MRKLLTFLFIVLALQLPLWAAEKPLEVKLGETFTISLESSRITGYHWDFAKPYDKRFLQLLSKKFIKPKYKLYSTLGTQNFIFKALKPGTTIIYFRYARPWDTDVLPLKTRDIVVNIELAKAKAAKAAKEEKEELSPEQARQIIEEKARMIVQVLADRDIAELAKYVHPQKGLRFTPHGQVNRTTDKVFNSEDLENIYESKDKLTWGKIDGQPIKETFADYFDRFVYDRNFAAAQQVGFNHAIAQGSHKNNIFEVYPQSIFVEFYLKGATGADWVCLRLVFDKLDDEWFLIGIIHDGSGS